MELRQTVSLRQTLKITAELQQAIKLLQLNRLELATLVQQELSENPVLEEVETVNPDQVSLDSVADRATAPDEVGESGVVQEPQGDKDLDWEQVVREYNEAGPLPASIVRRNEDLPPFDANLTRKDDLYDHLLWQLRMSRLEPDEMGIGVEIIHNIDNNGYLAVDVPEALAVELEVPLEKVLYVLSAVQHMDPLGVGARTLEECLLVQAEIAYPDNELVATIIQSHLPDLVGRGIIALARRLGVSLEAVEEARELITNLDPKPGRNFSGDDPQYVSPDVYVRKVGDDFEVVLNEDGLPKLRIGSYYKSLLDRDINTETKDYLKKKVRGALWFLRSIHQRMNTVRLVAESIVKRQKPFFHHGVSHLRPMVLRQVADEIGMHESTVSRVTSNKYMHTPHGLLPMKFFFNPGIESQSGDDVASEAVKHRIKALISGEDPASPLSDQQLVEILDKEGLTIARRTIAKYRTQLGILSSSKRVRLN